MNDASLQAERFDRAAAITRSLLGYGVLAGAVYLAAGLALALTREGFDFSQHPLSLLMLGERGWLQRANFGVTGLMTIAAAAGFARALRGTKAAARAGALLAGFGVMLVLSGVFPPDPMAGFPQVCFIKNIIRNPNIVVGDYTYYDAQMNPREGSKRLISTKTLIDGEVLPELPERELHVWAGLPEHQAAVFGSPATWSPQRP
jgi:hypothetical protein